MVNTTGLLKSLVKDTERQRQLAGVKQRGQVTDQNGAIVVGAKITARSSSGAVKATTADKPAVVFARS
jgi:hypothetical protein